MHSLSRLSSIKASKSRTLFFSQDRRDLNSDIFSDFLFSVCFLMAIVRFLLCPPEIFTSI